MHLVLFLCFFPAYSNVFVVVSQVGLTSGVCVCSSLWFVFSYLFAWLVTFYWAPDCVFVCASWVLCIFLFL